MKEKERERVEEEEKPATQAGRHRVPTEGGRSDPKCGEGPPTGGRTANDFHRGGSLAKRGRACNASSSNPERFWVGIFLGFMFWKTGVNVTEREKEG